MRGHGFHPTEGFAHGPTPQRTFLAWDLTTEDDRAFLRNVREEAALARLKGTQQRTLPKPVRADEQTANELRPRLLSEMVGQDRMRGLLKRLIDTSIANGRTLDHILLVGAAGTGKSTIALAVANELETDCYRLEAPISHDTLLDLREVCQPRDVIFIDEIHQQAAGDRRGRTTNNTPEVLLGVLEDRKLVSGDGILDFPAVTFIGATTDEGQLPDPFVMRFPIRPVFEPYTERDMQMIALLNARALGVYFDQNGAAIFARAGRLTPRVVNNYVRNAAGLASYGLVTDEVARMVVHDLNGTSDDGLSADQQRLLRWLYQYGKKVSKAGVIYQASVATLATATGHGRDTKSIVLRVEPWLLACGLLRITSGGRALTDLGIQRAMTL